MASILFRNIQTNPLLLYSTAFFRRKNHVFCTLKKRYTAKQPLKKEKSMKLKSMALHLLERFQRCSRPLSIVLPGSCNDQVFQGLDFVISEAKRNGIKLVLSLVNHYENFQRKRAVH